MKATMGTSCDCPNPPGGVVTCGPDQAAYCSVDADGNLRSGCITLRAGSIKRFLKGDPDSVIEELSESLRIGMKVRAADLLQAELQRCIAEEQIDFRIEVPEIGILNVALPEMIRRRVARSGRAR
ncbi:hypothetical protein [Lentisalinibacter salinarum]|uniref:hypothetical protein n=1 Tax=Lentisalinibacter salinarum TaxID=2992239 RepID=UPI003863727D